MGAVRSRLRRWHVWLGWVVGLPVLFWVVTGLVMIAKPIDEVRGEHLMHEMAPVRLTAPLIPPAVQGVPLKGLTLEPRAAGPRWVVTMTDGTARLADPATGALLPVVSATEAMREVMSRYTGEAKVKSVVRTDPDRPPTEFRRPVAAWRVEMSDNTHFYVDAGSGAVIARRTGWWRFYDFMWALHIMDFDTREPSPNKWIVTFGVASLLMAFLALALLPMTIRRRRKTDRA
jgi:hypothetical protein